jgi:RyR domain
VAAVTAGEAKRGLFTPRRILVGLLAATAALSGYVGLWQYVHSPQGSGYGQAPWDIVYYDLQLFVLGSVPLQGPGPFNPALETARYLAAATTVYALAVAASALFGDSWRRWRRRRAKGHAIVVGSTPTAAAIAAWRAKTLKVLPIGTGDAAALRSVGIGRARVVYACSADREDVAVNVATALAAASLGRRDDLRINVQVTDPTLALGLKARRLMREDGVGQVVDFFSVDEMAARRYVESDPFDEPVYPRIMVVGAGAFAQAIVVEFVTQWRQRSPQRAERVWVTLVDDQAETVVAQLTDRWPVVREVCDIQAVHADAQTVLRESAADRPYYRAYFCQEDEHLALSTALSAVALWQGGPRSVVVRLNQLGPHGAAFDREDALLDNLGGRLSVVDVAAAAGDLVAQDREPVRDLARSVHARYIAERLATGELAQAIHESYLAREDADGVAMGAAAAMVPWEELSPDLRHANQAQARDFTTKLRLIGCTIAPRSAHLPIFELRDEELERLAIHEHDRWVAERKAQGWHYGPQRDDKRRLHPDLVPWEKLGEKSRNRDRDAVRNLPTIYEAALADVGLQIVRLTR